LPECNFVAWGKKVAEKCPECGSPYMVEKWLKAGAVWQRSNAECKHKQGAVGKLNVSGSLNIGGTR